VWDLRGERYSHVRCRANIAHTRQSGPESGPDFQTKGLACGPFSLGIGTHEPLRGSGLVPVQTPVQFSQPSSVNFSQLLINMNRFRGGLVFTAHRLVYHSTLGLRVIKKKKKSTPPGDVLVRRAAEEERSIFFFFTRKPRVERYTII